MVAIRFCPVICFLEFSGRGTNMPRQRRGAWIYTPDHGASRAQENVQTQGDDTCFFYQVLLDNTRDAGRRTVRPRLSLQCTLV